MFEANYYIYNIPSGSIDWAGWFSAIATLLAVISALGMHIHSESKRDKKDKLEKQRALVSLLKALESEYLGIEKGLKFLFSNIDAMKEKYLTEQGSFILNAVKDIQFVHTNRDYLCLYEGNVDKVGTINNDELRNKVIEFYVTTRILFDRLEMHKKESNIFNKVLEMADSKGNISEREYAMQIYALKSIEYVVPQIKEVKELISNDYKIILGLLKSEISIQEKILKKLK